MMLPILQEATRAADLPNVQTRVMDAQRLELEPGSFDAAMARFSLQFVPDVRRALAEVRGVLKPGGRFVASVFSAVERVGRCRRWCTVAPTSSSTPSSACSPSPRRLGPSARGW